MRHLDELEADEAAALLADVTSYVGEMREAWGLEIVATRPSTRKRWIASVAVVLLAAGVGAGISSLASGGSDSPHVKDAVVVPTLFGLSQDKATALLTGVGLRSKVSYQPRPTDPGNVLSQHPSEGVKAGKGSEVIVDVSAPIGGPLLTSMPTVDVPITRIAAIKTGKYVVLYYAAVSPGVSPAEPKNRLDTVDGITTPIPNVGPGPGICTALMVMSLQGGGGHGACTDPRKLPRISYSYAEGYVFGLTSLPATSIRIDFAGTPAAVTVTTYAPSQFNGLRYFVAKSSAATSKDPLIAATVSALSHAGKVLLTLDEPAN
jgi:hypothetical protein